MRADMVPGAKFPDYELTDHTRTRRRLSELQGTDPMILLLSRGHFCPKDHQQHLELAAFYPRIAVAYTKIVTISTDNILESNEFRDAVGAQWPFLSDSGRKVQQDLDIQEYTDLFHNPMIPHTLVLEPGLVIYKIYNVTGSGEGPPQRICGRTYGRFSAEFAPIGIYQHRGCAKIGRVISNCTILIKSRSDNSPQLKLGLLNRIEQAVSDEKLLLYTQHICILLSAMLF